MADYATSTDVKALLNVNVTTWDVDLGTAITTASRAIDSYCGRYFSQDTTATARVFRPDDYWSAAVDDISTTVGLVIKTSPNSDGTFATTWATTDYELEPLNGVVGGLTGWPYTRIRSVSGSQFVWSLRSQLQVTAKWGWAAIPAPVSLATKLLAVDLWKRKDATWGIVGGNEFGAIHVSPDIYKQVGGLLAPYRRGFGIA